MIQDVDGGKLVYDIKYEFPSGSRFTCKDRFCEDIDIMCIENITDSKYRGKCYGDECMNDYWTEPKW